MSNRELNEIKASLIAQEHLPTGYAATVERVILPMAMDLVALWRQEGRPLVISINGAQGTGKSTLSLFLQTLLSDYLDCPCVRFSLDDIYLTHEQRQQLGRDIHPLLQTRGVPGTHDLALGQSVIDRLLSASSGQVVAVPAFDKAMDDRRPDTAWPHVEGPVAVVLVEGWCQGAVAEDDASELARPMNVLEREEDSDGTWRQYVNRRLATDYRAFFGQMDRLIMLRAPSMECVLEWRTLQEHKLAQKRTGAQKECGGGDRPSAVSRIMSDAEVARFIMHYERITRASLAEMPQRADVVIDVNEHHELSLSRQELLK